MPDMVPLVEQIQKIAVAAVQSAKPVSAVYGTVTSVSPLTIVTEQKLTLSPAQLVLSNNVKDYYVTMTVAHDTEETEGHKHRYEGEKAFRVHLGLSKGERVILIQEQGGQKYIVIDRVGDNDSESGR